MLRKYNTHDSVYDGNFDHDALDIFRKIHRRNHYQGTNNYTKPSHKILI